LEKSSLIPSSFEKAPVFLSEEMLIERDYIAGFTGVYSFEVSVL